MLDRDALYTTAWFGLMAAMWFGWAQEAPARRLRAPLIAGAVVGLVVAIGFGMLTALSWSDPTALEGRYPTFGLIVGAEVGLAGLGAAALALRDHRRWMAWWVAVVVAVHFVSLAWILGAPSLAVLGGVEVVALVVGARLDRARTAPTSRWAGPVMGLTILAYSLGSAVLILG